jgi:hypothetical protein
MYAANMIYGQVCNKADADIEVHRNEVITRDGSYTYRLAALLSSGSPC